MSTSSYALKVGLVVVVAVLLAVGTVVMLGGNLFPDRGTKRYKVHFERAVGIRSGMPIKVAGIDKGYVKKLDIVYASPYFNGANGVAEIDVRLDGDIALREGAIFQIAQEGLLGESFLQVLNPEGETAPLVEEGATLPGVKQPDLAELMAKANQTLSSVNELMSPDSLGGSIGKVMESMNETLVKVDAIVIDMGTMMKNSSGYIDASLQNVQATSANFLALSENLSHASESLMGFADDPVYGENFRAMSNDMRQIASNMNQMSTSLNRTISDPAVQQDTKQTIRATRQSMEETRKTIQAFQGTLSKVDALLVESTQMVGSVNGIIGEVTGEGGATDKDGKPTSGGKSAISGPISQAKGALKEAKAVVDSFESRLDIDSRIVDSNRNEKYNSDDERLRDINLTLGATDLFVQVGVDNIGGDDGWNFLVGRGNPNEGFSYKTGAYRGEAGAGVSYREGKNAGIDAMMYDSNDPKYNLTGKVPMGDSVDIIVGVEDITGDATATVGIGTAL
jgi:phospholipid/cholesterol/gamma-HCH transport system substrate-binding protein